MAYCSVLIVSDESTASRFWAACVTEMHCFPVVAESQAHARTLMSQSAPHLVVIDVNKRATSGVQICADLREHSSAPFMLLTPINNESHSLEAYAAGADECVIKPISPSLFIAKLRAWLRQDEAMREPQGEPLRVGTFGLDPELHTLVDPGGRRIKLSRLEFRTLHMLATHPRQAFQPQQIFRQVWGSSSEEAPSLVKNVIYRLRKKIETDTNQPRHLRTVTGGYSFNP